MVSGGMKRKFGRGPEFEKRFIDMIEKIRDEMDNNDIPGMKKYQFSDRIFEKQYADPGGTWQKYLKIQETGKRQRVTLEDAYRMAIGVHKKLENIIWDLLREMDKESDKEPNKQHSPKDDKKNALG